jgi:hypothetical protein
MAYQRVIFSIILNDKHDYKNVFAYGCFHSEGINTFSDVRFDYMKKILAKANYQHVDDIMDIVILSKVSESDYKNIILDAFACKNLRFNFMIDVTIEKMANPLIS